MWNCGGTCGTWTGFLRILRLSPVNVPKSLRTHVSPWSEKWARWWPQLRDKVSPHRHEEQQQQQQGDIFMQWSRLPRQMSI
jgi:hypothetical protein